MTKISAIIPVYNSSKFLDKCISTLINQTLKDIEIIFVDDDSNDNSVEILESYAKNDTRIKILKQNHKKQGAARNYGIKSAKGEYIAFIDSDDWVELNMFELLYDKANKTNSDIVMFESIDYNDEKGEYRFNPYNSLVLFNEEQLEKTFSPKDTLDFIFNISVVPWLKIYKTDFLKKNNITFPENIYYEDTPFFFNSWLSAERISLVNKQLYVYRKNENSISSGKNEKNRTDFLKTIELTEKVFKKSPYYKKLKKPFLQYRKNTIKFWYNITQDPKTKFILFLHILLCHNLIDFFKPTLNLLYHFLFDRKNKTVLWGASNFLIKFLKFYKIKNPNIIGIIDKDENKINTKLEWLNIYPPEKIKELNPDKIVISIVNFKIQNKRKIEKYIKKINFQAKKIETI